MTDAQTLPEDLAAVTADIARLLGRFGRRAETRAMEGRKISQADCDRLLDLRDRVGLLLDMTRRHRYPTQEELKAAAERWAL